MSTALSAVLDPPFAALADRDALRAALREATQGAAEPRVAVAVRSHGGSVVAAVGGADEAAPIGCLAKLVTAALARAAVHAGRLSFDDDLVVALGAPARPLGSTTLRQLLEHTHGLDDSLLAPPRPERGFLDAADLLARAAALPRFAPPGACYSYGHLGAWLAAVVLERVHGRRFSELARAWLEQCFGTRVPAAATLCPALGTGLALTAGELVRLAAHAAAGPERWPSGAQPGTHGVVTPLPGWNPLERGVFLGWKHAGRTWFGHQSAWPGASAYVRAQPATGLAVAVLARSHAAAVIAARLFARALPELFELKPPPRDERAADDWALPGRYGQAALEVDVVRDATGLTLTARDGREPAQTLRARLMPAGGAVHLASPANERVPFAQLVRVAGASRPWLWNGRCVLRPCR